MGKVLDIVYRAISTHLIYREGYSLKECATGAVTLIQRFVWYGIPAALNLHFHILFLDGVCVYRDNRSPRFQRVRAPDTSELEELVRLISKRVGRCLQRQGLLEQDAENSWMMGVNIENHSPRVSLLGEPSRPARLSPPRE